MMTKQIIFGVLLAIMIVIICSCNNPLPSNPQKGAVLENSIGMKLVWIPRGEFEMGSDHGEPSEQPVHTVKITNGYYMGIYEVTQEQYQKVMSTNPSEFKGDDNLPVDTVSWDDSVEFCKNLSQKEGKTYRLPTEAEWEYACRAGTTSKYSFGDSESQLVDYAWYDQNSDEKTHPVGTLKPNAWGLYDMHGNLAEWCLDYADWYSMEPTENPLKESYGKHRWGKFHINRGGCWLCSATTCSSANRAIHDPDYRDYLYGFRVVLDLE
jgi:formylglycine-generating enzyme required for sulfatase activity